MVEHGTCTHLRHVPSINRYSVYLGLPVSYSLHKIDITVFTGLGFTPMCRIPTKSRFHIGGYQKRVDLTNTCEQD